MEITVQKLLEKIGALSVEKDLLIEQIGGLNHEIVSLKKIIADDETKKAVEPSDKKGLVQKVE